MKEKEFLTWCVDNMEIICRPKDREARTLENYENIYTILTARIQELNQQS